MSVLELKEGGEEGSAVVEEAASRGASSLPCEGVQGGKLTSTLQPWTASATSRHQTDTEKAKKLELIRLLREDLENVRMLTERVRKREKKKLERVQLHKSVMDGFVFAKDKVMRGVLERVALCVFYLSLLAWDER